MAQSDNGASGEHEPGGLPAGLTADVRALIEMMARGGIAELSLATSAVKLRLRAHEAVRSANGVVPTGPALEVTATIAEPEGAIITAPMLGTFYRAPAPGESAFVDIGDTIEVGQTIGIIEAMKIMNEIPAEVTGTVVEFLVNSGQPVEYGQPLLRLAPQ
jgi:acetyl-CoA carboxylase biotin carboxyl carrier protein